MIHEPIEEKSRPKSFEGAMMMRLTVPKNIKPLLTLLDCKAQGWKVDGVPFWEISCEAKYIRIDAESIGHDEDKWRQIIGMMLDYKPGG